jgi:hypothetical protein
MKILDFQASFTKDGISLKNRQQTGDSKEKKEKDMGWIWFY